jgi:hypothetical protein
MNRSHTADRRESCPDAAWPQESGRPFQFNIRSLLLFTLLVGTVLGCIVNLPAMLSWAYRCDAAFGLRSQAIEIVAQP